MKLLRLRYLLPISCICLLAVLLTGLVVLSSANSRGQSRSVASAASSARASLAGFSTLDARQGPKMVARPTNANDPISIACPPGQSHRSAVELRRAIELGNGDATPLTYTFSHESNDEWSYIPQKIVIPPHENVFVKLICDPSNLDPGTYTANYTLFDGTFTDQLTITFDVSQPSQAGTVF